MPKFRTFFILLVLIGGILPAKVQAELRLETWTSYGQLAEQGAICASFSALMESQSVLNPDLGLLWQERRKFAGAIIRKAVKLELNRDSSEDEINRLIASYRDWVLSSLMIQSDESTNAVDDAGNPISGEALGRQKIKTLVNRQCKSLFEQGDDMIRQQNPKLAYLLEDSGTSLAVAQKPASETGPRRTLATTPAAGVTSTPSDNPDRNSQTPEPEQAELSAPASVAEQEEPANQKHKVELSIGGGNSFTLTLPGQKPVAQPPQKTAQDQVKTEPAPIRLVNISGPVPRPNHIQQNQPDIASAAERPAEPDNNADSVKTAGLIPMPAKQAADAQTVPETGADLTTEPPAPTLISSLLDQQADASVNLTTPLEPVDSDQDSSAPVYFAQLGAYSRLENAETAKQRLQTKFATLFSKLPLKITEVNDAGPRFYRIRTAALTQRQTRTVCDLLWPHRIACLVKSEKTR